MQKNSSFFDLQTIPIATKRRAITFPIDEICSNPLSAGPFFRINGVLRNDPLRLAADSDCLGEEKWIC